MKRTTDVVVASVALTLLSPLLVVVWLAVWVMMGRPVLFRQERSGLHGVPFDVLKFRTMREPRLGEVGPEHDMHRMSRLGRWLRRTSIDELPSLLNILRGEMSIVGPRPLPVHYSERYSPEQRRRLDVLPGLTGWAVINGRNQLSWDERFDLDVWYVDNQSYLLDLRIIARTVAIVVGGKDVNHSKQVTMTEFRGSTRP